MNIDDKIKLLQRNYWKKNEVNLYYDNKLTEWDLNQIFRKINNKAPSSKTMIYRDDVFKALNTTFEEELKNLVLIRKALNNAEISENENNEFKRC